MSLKDKFIFIIQLFIKFSKSICSGYCRCVVSSSFSYCFCIHKRDNRRKNLGLYHNNNSHGVLKTVCFHMFYHMFYKRILLENKRTLA